MGRFDAFEVVAIWVDRMHMSEFHPHGKIYADESDLT